MINQRDENRYEVVGDFDTRRNTFDMNVLTVKGVMQLLQELVDEGYGDKMLRVSYDSCCASTVVTRLFHLDEEEDYLFLEGF